VATRSRPAVVALLLCSGFTGLVYELCWSKRLANLLGNTGQAHAIVLATFMGGLACGAWLFGRAADRAKRPLVVYAQLELGVGLYALVFPWVLDLLGSGYLHVAPGLTGVAKTGARLFLAALAVLPPTLLMGGTVPAMTRHLVATLGTARRELSVLYASNSLGAAVGCLAAGMALIPTIGLSASERLSAIVNLVLGAAAWVLGRGAPKVEPAAPTGADVPATARAFSAREVQAALLGTALSGFTSMLFETTWIRVLSVVIGGTSYAFTLILTAFIFGISLGSFWLSTRPDTDALQTFGRLQLGLTVVSAALLPFFPRLPYVFLQANAVLQHGPEAWWVYQTITLLFCGMTLVAPTFLLGASFPAAARVAMGSVEKVGGQLGRVYLWNTLGTVLGALLGGLVLLPTFGLEVCATIGLVLTAVAGAAARFAGTGASGNPRRTLGPVVAVAVLAIFFAVSARGWAQMVASSGRFREWNHGFTSFADFRSAVEGRSTVKFYADDVFASVLVGEQEGNRRYLRINGKVDGSNGRDIDTQILAAHVGLLTHPNEVKKVLLVGIGAGITAGSVLAHPIEQLDLVEISPAVIDAARLFSPDNRKALDDPRCHVHVEDARTFLTLSKEQYDLIISVPSNPWVSGVSGLFSQDFFHIAKQRLAPNGRIVQWIHTYESSAPLVKLVVRTLRDSFEHGTTWVGSEDLVMLASRESQTFDVERIEQRMQRPEVKEDLARLKLHDVTTLLARQVHGDEGQKKFGGTGPVNTDDLNLLEYGSPVAYFVSGDVVVPDERTGPEQGRTLELSRWLDAHPLTAPQAEDLTRHLAWVHGVAHPLVRGAADAWLRLAPESDAARTFVAASALGQGAYPTAREVLAEPIARGAREPDLVTQWLVLHRAEAKRERAPWRKVELDEALKLGEEVLREHPGDDELQEAVERLRSIR
jgi:spermidine synthase